MNRLSDLEDLFCVEKPARYIDGEWNSIGEETAGKKISFALAYPDSYEIAQSGLGLKILYHIINSSTGARAERVFAPLSDMIDYMREKNLLLSSLESGMPLSKFDIVGFTLQHTLTYTNILMMLDLGGIPLRSRNRYASHPLIIAGGPGAFNAEPMADFFDALLVGDGEEAVLEIIDCYAEWKEGGSEDKGILLNMLSKIEGVYVPSLYQVEYDDSGRISRFIPIGEDRRKRVARRFLADLNTAPFPVKPVVPYIQTIHDRVMIEIFRGCTRGCRFCQAGFIYRPIRERDSDKIVSLALDSLKNTGYDEVSLLSLSCTDYSAIEPLIEKLSGLFKSESIAISLPSLRMDYSSLNLLEKTRTGRKCTLTFAPEAGSQRLRDVINKNVTEQDFIDTLMNARRMGWQAVKLYFMIGLPTETMEDVEGIARMVHSAREATRMKFHVSISNFVPLPFTPFQWEKMESHGELQKKADYLKDRLRNRNIQFNWHDPKSSFLEGVFSRGDRRLSTVIESAYKSGCIFDSWSDCFNFDLWMENFQQWGIAPEFYLRQRNEDERHPWEILDSGVSRDYLMMESRRALSLELTGDCRDNCRGCGLCRDSVKNRFSQGLLSDESILKSHDNIFNRVMKVRLCLSRAGGAKWISHLDAARMLERAIRRASVPVSYSEGYHPRPRITFLLPLPLGYSTDCEWVDIYLYRNMDIETVHRSLSANLPRGVSLCEVKGVDFSNKISTKDTFKIEYQVRLDKEYFPEIEEIQGIIKEFLKNREIIKQKKNKKLNIRPLILDIIPDSGDSDVLIFKILMEPSGSIKPDEIIGMIFGEDRKHHCSYHRKSIAVRDGRDWINP